MDESKKRRGRRPVEKLTESQRRTLREIQALISRCGFPPTVQEVAQVLGIAPASAYEQLKQLARKGYVKREPRKARSLTVLLDADEVPAELVAVPLLGCVAAGYPLLAEENKIGEVFVEPALVRDGRCFALRVSGQSMENCGIGDVDVVIVRQQPIAENGDIVVAMLNGESTVKRLSIQGSRIELRPENPQFRPIVVGADDELRVIGKVLAVRRICDGADAN